MRATPLLIKAENDRSTWIDGLAAEHNKIILPDDFGRTELTIEDPFSIADSLGEVDAPNDFGLRSVAHRAVMTNDHEMMRSVCYQVLYGCGTFGA